MTTEPTVTVNAADVKTVVMFDVGWTAAADRLRAALTAATPLPTFDDYDPNMDRGEHIVDDAEATPPPTEERWSKFSALVDTTAPPPTEDGPLVELSKKGCAHNTPPPTLRDKVAEGLKGHAHQEARAGWPARCQCGEATRFGSEHRRHVSDRVLAVVLDHLTGPEFEKFAEANGRDTDDFREYRYIYRYGLNDAIAAVREWVQR